MFFDALRSLLLVHVQGLRHPSVEAARGSSLYIPNDVEMRKDSRLAIVTGWAKVRIRRKRRVSIYASKRGYAI